MNTHRKFAALIVLLGGLAVVHGTALGHPNGRCVSADLPWHFVLPDGSRHAPGEIRICLDRAYTPSTGLHRLYVDGNPTGILMSRSRTSEGGDGIQPFLLFQLGDDRSYTLTAYAWPGRNALRTHRFLGYGRPAPKDLETELVAAHQGHGRWLIVPARPV